jgi:enterobactin synthetase component D
VGGDPGGWSLALAHGRVVAIAVDADPVAIADLHADEQTAVAALAPGRRPEWIAGRRALRAALRAVGGDGAAGGPLLTDDRGAPRLPAGLVGSISHKRALAVALAAGDDGWRVGVDLEALAPRRFDIAPRVLTAAERAALAGVTGLARDHAVLRAFALKEAVYKAIDPFLRRHVGFLEVEVWPDDAGGAVVEGAPAWGLAIEATWQERDEHVLCTARARRR